MNRTTRLYLRMAVTLLLLLGLLLVIFRFAANSENTTGYSVLRWLHIIVALAVIGLYEANMARSRSLMTPSGKQVGMVGRIVLTLTLLYGIFLLLDLAANWITGGAFSALVWVHVVLGLASVAFTEAVFSRRRLTSNS